jgi:hypothetical protein
MALGAIFYFIMAAAGAGIVIPMYPILKEYNEGMALGAVGFRIIEGAIFLVSGMCILALVPLSQEYVQAGASAEPYFQTIGDLLLTGYTIDQAVVPGVFAFSIGALMYYYIFYQTKLVPRWLSVWGLVGVTLGIVNGLYDMFGGIPNETVSMLLDLPIFAQEMVLAVWLIVKGFNSSARRPSDGLRGSCSQPIGWTTEPALASQQDSKTKPGELRIAARLLVTPWHIPSCSRPTNNPLNSTFGG